MPKTFTRRDPTPLLSLTLAALTVVSLSACDASESSNSSEDAPRVLATFSVLADITSEIGGDRVTVESITPVNAEVHEYDPTPQDVAAAADADLIVENGLGLEAWFEQFIAHSEAPVVTASDGVETQQVTSLEGHPDSEAQTDMPTDPHGWTSPEQALVYVENIESALSELAPEFAEDFERNAAQYRAQLEDISDDAQQRISAIDTEIYVVTCEGAFGYLASDLGLSEHYLWPLNAEDEGSPRQVEAQIQFVNQHQVDTIFCESTVPIGPQEQVAQATGAVLGELLYVDSISDVEGPVPSYVQLLEHNIDAVLSPYE